VLASIFGPTRLAPTPSTVFLASISWKFLKWLCLAALGTPFHPSRGQFRTLLPCYALCAIWSQLTLFASRCPTVLAGRSHMKCIKRLHLAALSTSLRSLPYKQQKTPQIYVARKRNRSGRSSPVWRRFYPTYRQLHVIDVSLCFHCTIGTASLSSPVGTFASIQ